jgi:hypothetical protein
MAMMPSTHTLMTSVELGHLAALHAAGTISDDEFLRAKLSADFLRGAMAVGSVIVDYDVTLGSDFAEGDMILHCAFAEGGMTVGCAFAMGGVIVGSELAVGSVIVRCQVAVVDMIVDCDFAVGTVSVGGEVAQVYSLNSGVALPLCLAEAEGVSDVEELNAILDRVVELKEMLRAPERVEGIAAFVARHFRENEEPLGFKAVLSIPTSTHYVAYAGGAWIYTVNTRTLQPGRVVVTAPSTISLAVDAPRHEVWVTNPSVRIGLAGLGLAAHRRPLARARERSAHAAPRAWSAARDLRHGQSVCLAGHAGRQRGTGTSRPVRSEICPCRA